ncbi:hypothetical protein chiPu_0007663 [Chiloscyllium punctatum]|uniref:Uncharacterized protein n=1 Tax=Chiloscyllium punctatum TaxID=137246 RepID=A0A401SFN8_CHIPU|nr:hypothetical protein [Chiloscyllium punctatum]
MGQGGQELVRVILCSGGVQNLGLEKSQPNGRAGTEPLDEEILHPFEKLIVKQQLDTEKKTEKTKKNKKKPKADMKQLQEEPQNWAEGKETDEGAWETKISSREKRQQRRRDRGINESPSVDSSLPSVGSEAVPAQQHTIASAGLGPRKTKGVETAVAPGWGEQLTVNGGSWCDIPVKLPTQINATKDDKWRQIPVLANAKRSPDQPAWGQESSDTNAGSKEWAVPLVDKTWSEHALYPSIGAWAGVNNRMNTSEQKPPFSTTGINAAETEEQEKESISGDQEQLIVQDQPEKEIAPPVETICTSEPAEVEEAQLVEITEEPAVIMESSSQDITSQVPDTLSETELPVSATKQNNLPPSQAKSDENWESPKQIKKKKRARRET